VAHLHFHSLFDGPLLRVRDVACRAPRSGCGPEEHAGAPALIFPRRGVFECHIHRHAVVADANSLLLMRGGETYRVSHPAEDGDDCTVLQFDRAVLDEALPGAAARATRSVPLPAPLQYRLRLFHHALARGGHDRLQAEEVGLDLLAAVAQGPGTDSVGATSRSPAVERARAFIASRPEADVGIGEVARAAHRSEFHLARRFRAELGTSMHRYRLQLRLALALERLAGGEDDLAALAVDLGFAHHSHFSASFRRVFGQTPARVRATLTRARLAQLRRILTAHGAAPR
jgi:AraC-like DNA-binding protein